MYILKLSKVSSVVSLLGKITVEQIFANVGAMACARLLCVAVCVAVFVAVSVVVCVACCVAVCVAVCIAACCAVSFASLFRV